MPWVLRGLGLLVLVALAFFGVDIIGALELMLDADPWLLFLAFSIFCSALLMRMVVWIRVARSLRLGYRRLQSYIRLFLIGWSAGLGLPQGASPLARAAVIAADGRSVGRGVAVDIADRLLQAGSHLVLLTFSAAYLSAESTQILRGLGIGIAIAIPAIALILAVAWMLRPHIRRLPSFTWQERFFRELSSAIGELRRTRPSELAVLLSLSIVPSVLSVTALYFAARSIDVPLSYPVLMAAFTVVSLTVLLPISINGLGPREGIFTVAVAGAGFNSEAGVALGLLWFAIQTVTRLAASASWLMSSHEEEYKTVTVTSERAETGSR